MSTGRTLTDYQRIYIDGYDLSCYALDSGAQGLAWEEYDQTAFCNPVHGVQLGRPSPEFGPLNAVFDNTATSGFHVLANAAQGVKRNIMLTYGIRAAPVNYDPCFCIPAYQLAYKATGEGVVNATVDFSGKDANTSLNYRQFWGDALHVMGSETGANSSTACADNGAATALGGWLMYHIYSITGAGGTATISVDDSADGASFSALSGATSGAIAQASAPISGIVQLGTTATVRRYLRWQLALSTSTACVFALAFMRNRTG